MTRIYLSSPHVDQQERELLIDAFDSNWIAPLGPHVDAFEKEMAQYIGVGHAAALSSGTAALHLGLLLLGVGPGDEVITSTLTFAATANAICYTGAKPVFLDVDPHTWTLDPSLLTEELAARAAIGKLPKAVVPVDLYGQCADYAGIEEVCRRYEVPILEDAAEGLGAIYHQRKAGAFGDAAILSFNGNKIITTSGGGMLLSNNEDLVQKARYLATQARDPAPHYQHSEIGYNYRMSNLLAAVGRGQLQNLPARVKARREVNATYRSILERVPGITFMPEANYGQSTFWLTAVTVSEELFGRSREEIRLHLESLNIESRPVWKPMHLQPAFEGAATRVNGVAAELFDTGLCLPSGSNLPQHDTIRIAETIRDLAL